MGNYEHRNAISIHATRVGGDCHHLLLPLHKHYFNPRHPRGWRLSLCILIYILLKFQSTPPAWVATIKNSACSCCDRFQSTPPAWVATYVFLVSTQCVVISIHATRVGGDSAWTSCILLTKLFQSTPPAWVAT